MSYDPPDSPAQNPAPPAGAGGQDYITRRAELVGSIMAAFRAALPSNYAASTNGPWYSLQFQAMAEQLADIQLGLTDASLDVFWDFTRPEYLWQTLGRLVFPAATDRTGIPSINGDKSYRVFLQEMVKALLAGAKTTSLVAGLSALDPSMVVTVVERYLASAPRDPNGRYTLDDQFVVDIFIEGFPSEFSSYDSGVRLVVDALKPAHVLVEMSYLFQESLGNLFDDNGVDGLSIDYANYHYDDLRKWCHGAAQISGTGTVLSGRLYLSDPTVSFESVSVDATLRVDSGANAGVYRVLGVRGFVYGAHPTAVAYTTSSGGSGTLTVLSGDTAQDPDQDWGDFPIDETLTIASGVNTGTYLLRDVLGGSGGPLGKAGVSGDTVRIHRSVLKVTPRFSAVGSTAYSAVVDRLGVRTPKIVSGEDASEQFYL